MQSNQKIVRKSFPKYLPPEKLKNVARETHLISILNVEEGEFKNHYEIGYHDPENLIDFGVYAGILIKEARQIVL